MLNETLMIAGDAFIVIGCNHAVAIYSGSVHCNGILILKHLYHEMRDCYVALLRDGR